MPLIKIPAEGNLVFLFKHLQEANVYFGIHCRKLTADGVRHLPHYRSNTKVFNRLFLTDNNITVKEFKNFKPRKMAFWNTFLPHLNCPEKKCQSNKGRSTVPHIVIVLMCCSVSTFYMTFLRWI